VSPLRFHTRRQPAVTILELLVVLLVTGILVALAFPAGGAIARKGQVTEARVDLRNIHHQAVAASLLQDRELTREVYEELLVAEEQASEGTAWAAKYSYSATPELPEAFRELTLEIAECLGDRVFILSTLTKRHNLVRVPFSLQHGPLEQVPCGGDGEGDGEGGGGEGDDADGETPGGTPTVISAPAQPVITSATQVSREAVTVEFSITSSDTAPVERVEAWRDGTLVATLDEGASTYMFTGLSIGTSYVLEIRAFNTAGSSSATTTVTPAAVASTGVLDVGFAATGSGANSTVHSVVFQDDGKILIGGGFTTYDGVGRGSIARLNAADGSLDTSFNPGTGANGNVWSSAILGDGKILIGGGFTTYNGTARNRIARLNANGSLDTSFNPGSGANGTVHSLAVQPDGKILIGGAFTTYNGVARNRVARLNSDGSLDTSFLSAGAGANGAVYVVSTQVDGKIVIGGSFTSYNGVARNRIARLNADGSLDTSFLATGTGVSDWVWALAVQSDGKILIGGDFTSYNGVPRRSIARLNTDGSLDTSFVVGTAANDRVQGVAVQSDGKILVGGFFTTFNGVARNRVARLNADGSLDTSFNPGTGANGNVWVVAVQAADGKVVIGGDFTAYEGTARGRIARLE
jgi:uncharacterized delta-60 repeat protein